MKLTVNWEGGMAFAADPPSGNRFVMDSIPEAGGSDQGPSPVEALVASAAACMAMDVISILQKKKQRVDSYRLEAEWDRGPEGVFPRPVTAIRIRHFIKGEVEEAALKRSVELSDEKYCTVVATLRSVPVVTSDWQIEG